MFGGHAIGQQLRPKPIKVDFIVYIIELRYWFQGPRWRHCSFFRLLISEPKAPFVHLVAARLSLGAVDRSRKGRSGSPHFHADKIFQYGAQLRPRVIFMLEPGIERDDQTMKFC